MKLKLVLCLLLILLFPCIIFADNLNDYDEIIVEDGNKEYRNERIAIVIGINKYKDNDFTDLNYAVENAKYIKNILENQGNFKVFYIADESSYKLPTKKNVIDSFKKVLSTQRKKMNIKTVFFYYAGIGLNNEGKNYITFSDTDIDNLEHTALTFDHLLDYFSNMKKNDMKVMSFIDSPRLNENISIEDSQKHNYYWISPNIKNDVEILLSSNDKTCSPELNGYTEFTKTIIDGLTGMADRTEFQGDNDGFVSLVELNRYMKTGIENNIISNIENDYIINKIDDSVYKDLPQFTQQPQIEDISINGIVVKWKTNKKTKGILYVSEKSNFKLDIAKLSQHSITDDGLSHNATISIDNIDPKKEYYIKSVNTDLVSNDVTSTEIRIQKGKIFDKIKNDYEEEIITFETKIKETIGDTFNEDDYQKAIELCKKYLEKISHYDTIINIQKDKIELEKLNEQYKAIVKIPEIVQSGEKALENNNVALAIEEFERAIEIIKNQNIDNVMPIEPILEKLNRAKYSSEVKKLFDEAEIFRRGNKIIKAKSNYIDCLNLIKQYNLQDLYSVEDIEKILKSLPDLLSNMYIDVSSGFASNLFNFSAVAFNWNISYNYRLYS